MGQVYFITGGTGSFGNAYVSNLLSDPAVAQIVIFSRDELKQHDLQNKLACSAGANKIKFVLGDVRDKSRLMQAMTSVDVVVHAAALKQVPAAELNPSEFILTNIVGAQNVIECAIACRVKKVLALSTDKAAAPINLYGATKLCSDKLFCAAENTKGAVDTSFSVVRYGNVFGSRGSVVPYFLNQRSSGVLTLTDPRMTRFNISLSEGIELVRWALDNQLGGEIFVPKLPSYRVVDLAEAIAPECEKKIIGIRPGEKLHEEMVTVNDNPNTLDLGRLMAIVPPGKKSVERYQEHHGGTLRTSDTGYDSGSNTEFLSVDQLRALANAYVADLQVSHWQQ
jgi:UDP-N-acetylglucosamine 4,6-dehydratase